MLKRIFFVLAGMLLFFQASGYAITDEINFQGSLTSADGTAITSAREITFKLYDASINGNLLQTVGPLTLTPDPKGTFSTALPINHAKFNGGDRWMEVAVANAGGGGSETLSPRQHISAVPYAYRAITAESLARGAADAIPSGVIVMWSGTLVNIPAGWSLCDGTNGTPDLRNKFIMGASTLEAPGTVGGSDTHGHPAVLHSVWAWNATVTYKTPSGPLVTPEIGIGGVSGGQVGYWYGGPIVPTGTAIPLNRDAAAGSDNIAKFVSSSTTYEALPVQSLPPYYKLAFIMKL